MGDSATPHRLPPEAVEVEVGRPAADSAAEPPVVHAAIPVSPPDAEAAPHQVGDVETTYTVHATDIAPVQGIPLNSSGVMREVTGIPVNPSSDAYTAIYIQQALGGNPWAEPRGQFSTADFAAGAHHVQMELCATHMQLLQLAKSVRWFALLDCLLCILNALALAMSHDPFAWVPAVVIIGPVLGYKGAQTFRKNQVSVYAFFSLGNLAYRIAGSVSAYKNSDPALTLSLIMVVIQMYITRIIIRFYQLLKVLSEEEVLVLRTYCGPVAGFVYW